MSQTVRNNFIRELPKLELHCHLDGSLTQKSIEEIMERPVALSELQVEPDCRNLAEYLQKFDLPIQCLQTQGRNQESQQGVFAGCGKGKCPLYGSSVCAHLFH